MTRARKNGLFLLLLCSSIFLAWGGYLIKTSPFGLIDFRGLYYPTKSLLHHGDPYNKHDVELLFLSEGGKPPSDYVTNREFLVDTLYVNMPTTCLFVAPLALMPVGIAQALWLAVIVAGFILASILMWDLGSKYSSNLSLFLVCLVLANSEVLFATGNTAGIVISFCLIAVWCFLQNRFVPAGVLCLAISLVMKPHDVGFVWLYFLLAGGTLRKRALHTLALTAIFGLTAALWISHFAPHWMQEMHANIALISAKGSLNEPGVESISGRTAAMVVSLQAAFSTLRDDPVFYNSMSYLVSGALLLVWAIKTVRTRLTQEGAWLALAAVSALSLLPVYHRPYDAKLLLLAVPGCALLWVAGGPRRWLAFGLTATSIVFTSDIPLAILVTVTKNLHFSSSTLAGQLLTIMLLRPTSIILLAMGCFYLWVYVRYDPGQATALEPNTTEERPTASATM